MTRTAECCCGEVKVKVEGDPSIHALCHCNNCKKRTGSAFGISTYFSAESVLELGGDTNVYSISSESNIQERHFCPKCGTTVYWTASSFPNLVGVAGGCFVTEPLPEPSLTVSNEQMCPWLSLPKHWHTSLTEQANA